MFITDSLHHSQVQVASQKFGLEFLCETYDTMNVQLKKKKKSAFSLQYIHLVTYKHRSCN